MLGLFPKPTRVAVACLALTLTLLVSVAGTWHSERPDRDCPVCHTANLPLVAPSPAPALTPPRLIEHCPRPSEARHDAQVFGRTHGPRAPPFSA